MAEPDLPLISRPAPHPQQVGGGSSPGCAAAWRYLDPGGGGVRGCQNQNGRGLFATVRRSLRAGGRARQSFILADAAAVPLPSLLLRLLLRLRLLLAHARACVGRIAGAGAHRCVGVPS